MREALKPGAYPRLAGAPGHTPWGRRGRWCTGEERYSRVTHLKQVVPSRTQDMHAGSLTLTPTTANGWPP
jgi:hypothetical protein